MPILITNIFARGGTPKEERIWRDFEKFLLRILTLLMEVMEIIAFGLAREVVKVNKVLERMANGGPFSNANPLIDSRRLVKAGRVRRPAPQLSVSLHGLVGWSLDQQPPTFCS